MLVLLLNVHDDNFVEDSYEQEDIGGSYNNVSGAICWSHDGHAGLSLQSGEENLQNHKLVEERVRLSKDKKTNDSFFAMNTSRLVAIT